MNSAELKNLSDNRVTTAALGTKCDRQLQLGWQRRTGGQALTYTKAASQIWSREDGIQPAEKRENRLVSTGTRKEKSQPTLTRMRDGQKTKMSDLLREV
jgi:hypothetical protein